MSSPVSAADADYFIFPGEQSTANAARIVLTDHVDLNGTINGVIGSSITYSVEQIYFSGGEEKVAASNMNQTTNITLNGNNLRILSIQLFPGLNRITFKGLQGFSEVTNKIYIEYRNSPSLYDLKATIDNQQFDVLEDKTTVVYSAPSKNKTNADISITGKAPNADKVTVIVNNKSYTYAVSSTNDWSFAASPVNVRKGKNVVTIRVFNGSQFVETTRDIAFYNQEATFYDLQLTNGTKSVALDANPNFSVAAADNISVTGKVILPVKYTAPSTYDPDPTSAATLAASAMVEAALDGAWSGNLPLSNMVPSTLAPTDTYMIVEFTRSLGTGTSLTFTASHTLKFRAKNANKTAPANIDTSSDYSFQLRNAAAQYIQEVNYLPGYTANTTAAQLPAMTGSPLHGATVASLPLGVELLIGNPPATIPTVTLDDVKNSAGVSAAAGTFNGTQVMTTSPVLVTKTVDGIEQQFQRVFIKVDKLPNSGTLTLVFSVGGVTKTATINLLYGPFARYNTLFDGMPVNYDTTVSATDGQNYLLNQVFDNFKGELQNVSNPADIRFTNVSATQLQTVFFYINNIELQLETDGGTKFKLDDTPANLAAAFGAIYKGGENTVKFVFRTKNNNYVRETKFNIVPTNLPVIPAPNTAGVFPYSVGRDEPMPADPNFELKGTVFTTKEARMNVYGTFDFVDLGQNASAVNAKLGQAGFQRSNYLIRIQTGDKIVEWDLSDVFYSAKTADVFAGTANNDVRVSYDYDSQTFAFLLQNEQLPLDGSSKVYTISVFNSGVSGPRATYRLEVDPTAIPFTVISPKAEKRTTNQSFVDVIIQSPGAVSVEIDGEPARKIVYLDYSAVPTAEIEAFRYTVTGLKPNKSTEIDIVIQNGNDKIEDSIEVLYTPENIPGSVTLEKMKNSHKVFSGALSLTFPSGTNLIRSDYNSTDPFKAQVYNGNNIYFAIANPNDGVVDRHDFESVPAGFDLSLDLGAIYFTASFPTRFIKTSPVFWLDAGEADNVITPAFDPQTSGSDPTPFSVVKGETKKFFYDKDRERELIPSKRGTLTLAYDKSVRQGASTSVSVFRFDPYVKQWENIGGTVNEKNNTISVPFDRFGYYVVGKIGYGYNDVTDHPYAREAVETVYAKGVMNAFDPTGSFGTDLYVTRGEFTRMLVRALDIPLNYDGTKHFIDIGDTGSTVSMDALWDYRYIETAARAGFVKGTQPRVFSPDNHITRQDASVMLAKALNLKLDTKADSVKKTLAKAFKDEPRIDYYAKPSVAAIFKKGFITGSPVDVNDPKKGFVFEPESRLLRSDAAVIISKVMSDLKKIPKLYN